MNFRCDVRSASTACDYLSLEYARLKSRIPNKHFKKGLCMELIVEISLLCISTRKSFTHHKKCLTKHSSLKLITKCIHGIDRTKSCIESASVRLPIHIHS